MGFEIKIPDLNFDPAFRVHNLMTSKTLVIKYDFFDTCIFLKLCLENGLSEENILQVYSRDLEDLPSLGYDP